MRTSESQGTTSSGDEEDFPLYFGEWIKCRRQELDLTQEQLAKLASCSVFAIRKIEMGERHPSRQLAELLAKSLQIPSENQITFIKAARGELSATCLRSILRGGISQPAGDPQPTSGYLPRTLTQFIGRQPELSALSKLLQDPQCSLLTITGPGGIGKTRLAIELASKQQPMFPGGIYYVSLDSINSPEFIVPAVAEVFELTFSGGGDPEDLLINHLADRSGQPFLLLLDNLEHLLVHSSYPCEKEEIFLLLPRLLERVPALKILATSRERINLREEWLFELHGLPFPLHTQFDRLEDFSAIALFLQRARQLKVNFVVTPEEYPRLIEICQLIEGMPLAIELAATWVDVLSLNEIALEITKSLDFLSNRFRNVPERHRSIKAVFAHSWKLLSNDESGVLCRLAIFRGGFQHQAAEKVAGASLPILMSLLSKSFIQHLENGRCDLHALIRQCALEKLREAGHFEATCDQHLRYFVSLARCAQKMLRSEQQAEWFSKIEQEHNNIRAALEWAFTPGAPPDRVEEGLCLISSIDRYWAVRGHIREGVTWLERGLQFSEKMSLTRAKALRLAGWLVNHGNDSQTAIRLLQESVVISRQLNDVVCQADALDTLGDVFWRHGDFAKARDCYAESLELYRKEGNPLSIGLSLASTGRLHVDYGYYQEAELFLNEGLAFIERTPDLRGRGYCLNALGRLALARGEMKLATERFRQALRLNYELGHMVDLSECLQELAIIKAITGDENCASLLWAAATAIQNRSGFNFPMNDTVYSQAPASWLQTASLSEEWKEGEKMSLDQAVAYALET
ncbi:MAG: helix-turn-helix domain-containing protein [Chloroflexi bacterium]|nr:MAG: helix-turn-helix domain-containing protein [Chloroflexota bacterium]